MDTIREATKRRRELVWEQGKSKKKRKFARVGEHWGEQKEREQLTLNKPREENGVYTSGSP